REIAARDARSDLVLFACAFAERVTKRIIDLDATVVDAQIEAAVKLVLNATRLVIVIHPHDREVCARVTPMLERRRVAELPIEFLEDESLERGSVVLRTDKGLIDASVGMQIERIICALVGTERFADRMATPDEPEADDASGEPA
ncbi:MAG: FliH/SctL family protein, partial [Phycisphaerales bacterium]